MYRRQNAVHVKVVELNEPIPVTVHGSPCSLVRISLPNPVSPASWTAGLTDAGAETEIPFKQVASSLTSTLHSASTQVYVDIGFDRLGQRNYISLAEACVLLGEETNEEKEEKSDAGTLTQYTEKTIKSLQIGEQDTEITLISARYTYDNKSYNNYTVIDALSVGSNKLLLSNESCLLSPCNEDTESSTLSAIVNCHETQEVGGRKGKYGVKAAKVVCFPVHSLGFGRKTKQANEVFDQFNAAIWEGLQTGNVAVHCLAGMHRAAAVTVSHFLFRHFRLGHTSLPTGIKSIYTQLGKIRKGVEPLSYLTLVADYRIYLTESSLPITVSDVAAAAPESAAAAAASVAPCGTVIVDQ